MRALTIRQPWASLIAAGVKTIETRSWATSYRGSMLIHAGKHKPKNVWLSDDSEAPPAVDLYAMDHCWEWWENDDPTSGGTYVWRGPLGAVVAVADLVDVVPIVAPGSFVGHTIGVLGTEAGELGLWEFHPPQAGGRPTVHGSCWHNRSIDLPLGDFTPGRYGWLLDNVRPLAEPIPAKGRQGLWAPDPDLIGRVGESLADPSFIPVDQEDAG